MLFAGMSLVACGNNGTINDTQPSPLTTASNVDTTSSPQESVPMLPYIVVDEDLVTCFESPGRNESRYGVNPVTLVNRDDSFHVIEATTQDENTHPAYLWYKIENPKDPGTTCWLPAPSVHLVGDLNSIQAAAILPTATWNGNIPFIEPRVGDISCWFGPAETWGVAGTVKAGERVYLTSLLEEGDWYQIENLEYPGTHCWVRWIDILVYNDLSQLPVMSAADFPAIIPIEAGVNCRNNPNGDATVVGYLNTGTSVPIVAALEDHTWYLIENPDDPGSVCWVAGSVTQTSGDLSKIPILSNGP